MYSISISGKASTTVNCFYPWHDHIKTRRPVYTCTETNRRAPAISLNVHCIREHVLRGAPNKGVAPSVSSDSLDIPEAVAIFVQQQPRLRELLGLSSNRSGYHSTGNDSGDADHACQGITVSELSGGKINYVWRVSGPSGEVVLKYAAPYVRSIGPSFQLSQSRLQVEAEAMAAAHAACPAHVPALLLYDNTANVLVQELVAGPPGASGPGQRQQRPRRRVKLVDALAWRRHHRDRHGDSDGDDIQHPYTLLLPTAMSLLPPLPRCLAADLVTLLSGYLLRNSVYELSAEQHRLAATRLANEEVVGANVAVVFTDPWDTACERNRVPASVARQVTELRSDPHVRQEVSRLLDIYLTSREALIHNDLTAGNILVPAPDSDCDSESSDTNRGEQRTDSSMGCCNNRHAGSSVQRTSGIHNSSSGSSVGAATSASCIDRNSSSSSNNINRVSTTHLIDWEFATFGPMAYDIGSLLGNLLLSYCAVCGAAAAAMAAATEVMAKGDPGLRGRGAEEGEEEDRVQKGEEEEVEKEGLWLSGDAALLGCVVEVWEGLEARVRQHLRRWQQEKAVVVDGGGDGGGCGGSGGGRAKVWGEEAFVQRLLADSLGYAGCVVARLTFGMHHYPAVEAIQSDRGRAVSQRLAVRLAAVLLTPGLRTARGWVGSRNSSGCAAGDGGNSTGGGEAGGRDGWEASGGAAGRESSGAQGEGGCGGGGGSGGLRQLARDVLQWARGTEVEAGDVMVEA